MKFIIMQFSTHLTWSMIVHASEMNFVVQIFSIAYFHVLGRTEGNHFSQASASQVGIQTGCPPNVSQTFAVRSDTELLLSA